MPEYMRAFVQWLHEWQDLVGGFLGGLVGAVGAIYAVYLTLSKQRKHDTNNVKSAVVTEVTALSKYVADMLITALQLAGPIIADAAKSGPFLERRIREITVNQIGECVAAAKEAFHDAESFTDVPGTRPAGMSL